MQYQEFFSVTIKLGPYSISYTNYFLYYFLYYRSIYFNLFLLHICKIEYQVRLSGYNIARISTYINYQTSILYQMLSRYFV